MQGKMITTKMEVRKNNANLPWLLGKERRTKPKRRKH